MLNKKGFTLLELMVVVIILVGLAIASYPTYISSVERGRADEAVRLVSFIQAGEVKYNIDNESYTQDVTELPFDIKGHDVKIQPNGIVCSKFFSYVLVTNGSDNTNGNFVNATRSSNCGKDGPYSIQGDFDKEFIKCCYNGDDESEGGKVCKGLSKDCENSCCIIH